MGPGQATVAPTLPAAPSQAASQPPASQAPASEAPASQAAGEVTVNAEEVGDAGTIIVDGATGMTLYYFEQDEKDSGKSNCNTRLHRHLAGPHRRGGRDPDRRRRRRRVEARHDHP